MIRRLVMFNPKPEVTTAQVEEVLQKARTLLTQVPGVKSVEAGPAFDAVQKGPYRYGFTVVIEDEKAMQGYMVHPTHQQYRDAYFPIRDDFMVVDFQMS